MLLYGETSKQDKKISSERRCQKIDSQKGSPFLSFSFSFLSHLVLCSLKHKVLLSLGEIIHFLFVFHSQYLSTLWIPGSSLILLLPEYVHKLGLQQLGTVQPKQPYQIRELFRQKKKKLSSCLFKVTLPQQFCCVLGQTSAKIKTDQYLCSYKKCLWNPQIACKTSRKRGEKPKNQLDAIIQFAICGIQS